MKRVVGLMALLILVLTVTPATADFYVIAGGGRLGTAITTVPYTIVRPGLYYLNANLTSSGTNNWAIIVNASDVTIDLMGFCLTGPGKGSGGSNSGIVVTTGRTNVEIRNGSIKDFALDGMRSFACVGIRVVGLRVRETGGRGILLEGSGHLVMDCSVRNTFNTCIDVGNASLVKGSQVGGDGAATPIMGIRLSGASAAVGNNVEGVLSGIGAVVSGSAISGNTVLNTSSNGIFAGGGTATLIDRNSVALTASTGTGLQTGSDCTITNNVTDGLTYGANCALLANTVAP